MRADEESGGRLLVIFDGQCDLCNGLVGWLIRRDRRARLAFAASGSEEGAALLAKLGRDPAEASRTILVVREADQSLQDVLARSEAVAAVLNELPQPWPSVAHVMRWIPLPVRDMGYRIVARSRYRRWGRSDACPISAAGDSKRRI